MLLCLTSYVNLKSYSLSNRKFSVHEQMQLTCPVPNQCLQEHWTMVSMLLNGPQTTSSRRTRAQMYYTDKWAMEKRTTPTGDVQKTWRWQDLPTKSTRRVPVNLHHVLSVSHLSLSYPQYNQQPVQTVLVILSSDTFSSNTIHRRCDSGFFILAVLILKHCIF